MEREMIFSCKSALLPLLASAIVLFTTGCPAKQDQPATTDQAATQDQAQDPAAANLAPASTDSGAQQQPASNAKQSAPPPDNRGSYQAPDQSNDQGSYDPGYGEQPVDYAPQPPPPLPDYDQPQAPGDDYLWTPGYWAWGRGGYYWVPGAWVEAPYPGALWTPGYWGFHNHRYGFYRGYWGPHIGYYGGVNYGFGYVGVGYEGGYWHGGHFNYNRSVNNINVSINRNVYNHPVRDDHRGGGRVSFNGGQGGIQMRARPAEMAARREEHAPPMRAQIQHQQAASTNRAQFANVNHGRPASAVVSQPLAADRNVRVPASVQRQQQPQLQQRPVATPQQHQQAPQQQHQAAPQQRQQVPQQRQTAPQQQQRQAQPQQHQQAPQQHQAAPQQHPSAPQSQRKPNQEHPKK